jgi:hypothetical protein
VPMFRKGEKVDELRGLAAFAMLMERFATAA